MIFEECVYSEVGISRTLRPYVLLEMTACVTDITTTLQFSKYMGLIPYYCGCKMFRWPEFHTSTPALIIKNVRERDF